MCIRGLRLRMNEVLTGRGMGCLCEMRNSVKRGVGIVVVIV